jgi:hypothetical protein
MIDIDSEIERMEQTITSTCAKDFRYNRKDHFNRRGFLSSIAFSKEQLLPDNVDNLLDSRLMGSQL